MKKYLSIVLAIVLLAACFTMAACGNDTYGKLKESIKQHGSSVLDDYSVKLGNEVTLTDMSKYKTISLSLIHSSGGAVYHYTIRITKDAIKHGEYEWSFSSTDDGTTDRVEGKIIAAKITSAGNISAGFVEDVSKRSSITSQLAGAMVKAAQKACELMLINMLDFLKTKTELQPSDFGFNI